MKGPVADATCRTSTSPTTTARTRCASPIQTSLDITPVWSPDGAPIAYTSYRNGYPDIFVSLHLRGQAAGTAGQGIGGERRTTCRPGRPTASRSRSRLRARRWQPRDLRHEPRRQQRARVTNHPMVDVDADLVADRQPDRVRLRSHRQPADLHHERRRHRAEADLDRDRTAIGRPGPRRRSTRSPTPAEAAAATRSWSTTSRPASVASDHRRDRQQREPGVRAERPPHRVHRRPHRARSRSTRSTATARTCGRSRKAGPNKYPNWSQ